ncbi:MAG: glycosyltransferase, partial [Ignavibacteriae bacterium]|nr:glycosyltransferase [Ignavibacteriota bacterium]
WVSTLGRITPSKKQLEQLEIAKKLHELEFHIMGFADTSGQYFKDLESYIEKNKLTNVKLHPNMDYSKVIEILGKSKFFLHTIWNEPFGITTVQGIAAGCIPIVPNSGGQIEVVPSEELRFNSYDEAAEILRKQMQLNDDSQIEKLQKHILQFDTMNFRKNFKQVIELYTKGETNA